MCVWWGGGGGGEGEEMLEASSLSRRTIKFNMPLLAYYHGKTSVQIFLVQWLTFMQQLLHFPSDCF